MLRLIAGARVARWAAAGATAALLTTVACTVPEKQAELSVNLTEFKIVAPATAPEGQALKFKATNKGLAPHVLALDANGKTYATPQIQPGATATLQVPALKAGSYKLWCTIPGHREAGMETMISVGGASPSAAAGTMTSEQVDTAHKAGVAAFPAKTQGTGNVPLRPRIENGVKIFELTTKALRWEVTPGQFVDAFAYNGQIPGPQLRLKQGDRIRVILHNQLQESTTIHWHGLSVPPNMDGVPYISQDPVKPGASFTYEFTVKNTPGTYMYHSHHNATIQVGRGLYGSFIIEPAKKTWDSEFMMFTGDGDLGFNLNAKGFPATTPIVTKAGRTVLIRLANASGQLAHPMHLHGDHFTVVEKDGVPFRPYQADTVLVAPGETYDILLRAVKGTWAFHCHILSHAESEHGMHGMVTVVVVE